jgi:Quinolinate synthase
MYKFVRESTAKYFIIGTERGIMYKMKKENPAKYLFRQITV